MSENPAAPSNQPEYSVGEIARAIKRTLEGDFANVRVRGEITGFKRAGSGHCYLRLKDDEAVLDAVIWRGVAGRLSTVPEDGLEVIATGRITTYPGRSVYQLVIESLEPAGEGALLKLLEDRRRKLAAEGLFDEALKRPIPFLPEVIGVVTSPTGAVIRDILHRLRDRFPRHVLIWPVLVQGEGAAAQIAAAIAGFNRLDGSRVPRPDLIIVARGGGSLEDLWAFNEEVVVRAAAASEIPLISAVGHETDFTLIDFAADRRAPTPTAAAEMAVPVRGELLAQVLGHERRLLEAARRHAAEREKWVEGLARGLPRPTETVERLEQRIDDLGDGLARGLGHLVDRREGELARLGASLRHPRERIEAAGQALAGTARHLAGALRAALVQAGHRLERVDAGRRMGQGLRRLADDRSARLDHLASLLRSYSYASVLDRGFVLVRHGDRPITEAEQATPGMDVTLVFKGGREREALIRGEAPAARRRRGARSGGPDQGSLL